MPSLRDIQLRINGLQTTEKITNVMKMIAITKYRRLTSPFQTINKFANHFQETRKYMRPHPTGDKKYLIAFAPTRGLCASLNTKFDRFLKEHHEEHSLILIKQDTILSSDFFHDIIQKIQKFSDIKIAYVQFISTAQHIVKEEIIFPWTYQDDQNFYAIHDIYDKDQWFNNYLLLSLYKGLLNTQISENAARMLAMDNASKNATNIIQGLKLSYNKKRQEIITKEIIETGFSIYGE